MALYEPTTLRWVWDQCVTFIPGVRLGGICANKKCYHNSLENNLASWPGGYCCTKSADLTGDRRACRAIDLTMSTAEMIKRSKALQTACLNNDSRIKYLREWIGTVDGVNVICYIHDSPDAPWRRDDSRDETHLWHIHGSWFTSTVTLMAAAEGFVAVLRLDAPTSGGSGILSDTCAYGDGLKNSAGVVQRPERVDNVYAMQYKLAALGYLAGADGKYGDDTAAALKASGCAECGADKTGRSFGPCEADALLTKWRNATTGGSMFTARTKDGTIWLCWPDGWDIVAWGMPGPTTANAYNKLGLPSVGDIDSLADIGATPAGEVRDMRFAGIEAAVAAAVGEGVSIEVTPGPLRIELAGGAAPVGP